MSKVFQLHCDDAEFEIVTDQLERQAFTTVKPGLVEEAVTINAATKQVTLLPGQKLWLAMKFRSGMCGSPFSLPRFQRAAASPDYIEGALEDDVASGSSEMDAVQSQPGQLSAGRAWQHDTPIALRTATIELRAGGDRLAARMFVEVSPTPAVIDSRLVWWLPASTWFTKRISVQPYMIPSYRRLHKPDGDYSQRWRAICTRSGVSASLVSGEKGGLDAPEGLTVELRGRCGSAPGSSSFYVILFQGDFDASPRGLLQVVLHSCESRTVRTAVGHAASTQLAASVSDGVTHQVVVHAPQASGALAHTPCLRVQTTKPMLTGCAARSYGPQAQCYSSASLDFSVPPTVTIGDSGGGGFINLVATLQPAAAMLGQHSWMVTLVDADRRLGLRTALWSWLVEACVELPKVSRRYEALNLPADGHKQLKIKFEVRKSPFPFCAPHLEANRHLILLAFVLSRGWAPLAMPCAFIEEPVQPAAGVPSAHQPAEGTSFWRRRYARNRRPW